MTNEENIVSSIIKLSGSYAPTIIFDDWVTMAALEIASCTVLTGPKRSKELNADLSAIRQKYKPEEQVSKMLGHANLGVTQIYLDIREKDLERSHERYVL